jgi:biopolymer transport protein ExbD
MAKKVRPGGGEIGINMTPMIDCTFQLIIFFILAAKLANADLAELLVSDPHKSKAVVPDEKTGEGGLQNIPNKVIVNVVNVYGKDKKRPDLLQSREVAAYIVGTNEFWLKPNKKGKKVVTLEQAYRSLVDLLKKRKDNARSMGYDKFFVEVRGDRDIQYFDIQPVLEAAAVVGIANMNITAIADKDVKIQH